MTVVEPTSTSGESHGAAWAAPAGRRRWPATGRRRRAPAPEALGDVQHEVGGRAGRDPRPRDAVGREPHRGVRFQVGANVLDRQAGALEDLLELALGPLLRLGEDHLAAREGVDLGVALDLERRVQEVGVLADDARHRADAHRVRHAGVRRQLADHVGLLVLVGPERLADQHVALAAVEPAVEVGGGQPAQLELVRHLVREVAEGLPQAIERPPVDGLGGAAGDELQPRAALDAGVVLEALEAQAQEVVHPDDDRGRIDLGGLRLEPAVDVVVRVAFDGLEVELAGDLDDRLHAEPVDLDGRELPVDLAQRAREVGGGEVPARRPATDSLSGRCLKTSNR